jgi:hypothetical protein
MWEGGLWRMRALIKIIGIVLLAAFLAYAIMFRGRPRAEQPSWKHHARKLN